MSKPLKLYYDLISQPSRALYMFLKLTGIPFESHQVALRKNEHRSDEFKQNLNRFQKVPFIHHGDFKLAESVAITSYLCREYRDKVADHWYPKDSQGQARVDEYLSWQHVNARMPLAMYFVHAWMIPMLTQSPPDADTIATHESNMETSLDEIEELWLSQGHKFIVSDEISVADLFAAAELEQPKVAGYDVTKGRPLLEAYLKRVRESCNPVYDEAHGFINKLASKNKAKL
ncbi:glutathione S-transferase theta-1-like [Anthonomus grandis grandis]|uniref:glutathione S-transferase theta-1-like n=1 Tax=Anthonomus grandis grandis TaxID=2921223 RepID=UPI002165986C|nr:glutathione S-transferase theta-1-like [Anthonomus grandis grandis]